MHTIGRDHINQSESDGNEMKWNSSSSSSLPIPLLLTIHHSHNLEGPKHPPQEKEEEEPSPAVATILPLLLHFVSILWALVLFCTTDRLFLEIVELCFPWLLCHTPWEALSSISWFDADFPVRWSKKWIPPSIINLPSLDGLLVRSVLLPDYLFDEFSRWEMKEASMPFLVEYFGRFFSVIQRFPSALCFFFLVCFLDFVWACGWI